MLTITEQSLLLVSGAACVNWAV